MIQVAAGNEQPQRVHLKSLGEMEQKRSYRRDTKVLALPGMATKNGKRAWTRSSRSDAQRGAPTPFHQLLLRAGPRNENG